MERFAGPMIKATLVLSIIFNILLALYLIAVLRQFIFGGIMLFLAFIYAWCYWSWRFRIPFATVLLESVTGVTKRYPATVMLGVVGLIFEIAFIALWLTTFGGLLSLEQSKTISSGTRYALYIYTVLM
jgi:uncharacterized protein (DUF58 family)